MNFKKVVSAGMLFFMFLPVPFVLPAGVKEPATGIEFPATVDLTHGGRDYKLLLTGISVRKKWSFKIYAVAHYSEKPPGSYKEVLKDGPAKQLTIHYVRKISGEKIQSALVKDFKSNTTPEEYEALKPQLNPVLDYFGRPVEAGDVFVLRWLPGNYIDFSKNGKILGHLTDPVFARALWAIWFGEHAVVKRDEMLKETVLWPQP